MKSLFLIDAHSMIHRAFHALPPLTSPDGRPANALYGLASILLKIRDLEKPEYIAALFDRPEPTFRKKMYDGYKAQRPKAAEELISQLIEARNLFSAFGISTFEKAGIEADDLIATLVTRFAKEEGLRIVILTGDLDALQLVEGDKVVVRVFRRGITDTFIYDANTVQERYALSVSQIIDYKALVGDSSDNIKGVPGIGPKTAASLLQQYGSVEGIYSAADEDSRLLSKLGDSKESVLFAKKLVTLDRGVDMDTVSLPNLSFVSSPENLEQYFIAMGFTSLLKRLLGVAPLPKEKKRAKQKDDNQGSMF